MFLFVEVISSSTPRKVMQVTRTGLYSQEDDLAGMTEEFDDAQEPDWAPNAEADSPGSYGEPGDLSGSKKLKEPSKKRERKGMLRILAWIIRSIYV